MRACRCYSHWAGQECWDHWYWFPSRLCKGWCHPDHAPGIHATGLSGIHSRTHIYIYKYSRGGFHTPTILVSNFNVLHRHSSCIPVCPNCHGRMIKAILACNVCFLCQVGMLVYYSCPSFGGGVAKAPCVSPDRCYLAHYYATNFHHSFIPQTPIYIIVSLSDEYEEVTDEIPFRQIVLWRNYDPVFFTVDCCKLKMYRKVVSWFARAILRWDLVVE